MLMRKIDQCFRAVKSFSHANKNRMNTNDIDSEISTV